MRKLYIGAGAILALFTLEASAANAQTTASSIPVAAHCKTPSRNLSYGARDSARLGTAVAALQDFLASQSYLTATARGHFGPATLAAVKRFQKDHGLPVTGYAGTLTRAAIAGICNSTEPPTASAPTLRALSPQSGSVGTKVTLTGVGFGASNTILMDGMVAARGVPITSSIAVACTTDPSCIPGIRQTVEYTIPTYLSPDCAANQVCAMYAREVTPAAYQVTVKNDQGTSNALPLVVTPTTGSQ